MALKMFAKQTEVETSADETRMARLEKNVQEMTAEMGKLKNEVDTMIARQQGFRLALRRLREYLEERGVQERTAAEVADDENSKAQTTTATAAITRKDKSSLH